MQTVAAVGRMKSVGTQTANNSCIYNSLGWNASKALVFYTKLSSGVGLPLSVNYTFSLKDRLIN